MIFITVFSGTATKFCNDIFSKHPTLENKSLICWDIVLVSLPAMLLGNIIGLNANIVFPDWLILFIFVIVLITNLISCVKKYKEIVKLKTGVDDAILGSKKDEGEINKCAC